MSLIAALLVIVLPVFMIVGVGYAAVRLRLSDTEDALFSQLRIQNADRRIGTALQGISGPAKIKMELIAGSEFWQRSDSRTEIGIADRTYSADELLFMGVDVDALFVTGRLQARDYARELWPGRMATQEFFPGLFR